MGNLVWMPKTSVIVEVVAQEDANADYSYIATLVDVVHIGLPASRTIRANRTSFLEVSSPRIVELAGMSKRQSIDTPLSESA